MSLRAYKELQEVHIAELEAWIAQDPSRWNDGSTGRTIRSYCAEYGDRFAAVAHKAKDLGYPRAFEMLREASLFEELFT